jgi:hypothetical protein
MKPISDFPVTAEIDLSARRLFRRRLRINTGTALIAELPAGFAIVRDGRPPPGATAVAEISLRPRTVTVSRSLPGSYVLDVAFACLVTDPVLILEFGCRSVEPVLLRYLGPLFDVAPRRLAERLRAQPPYIPGMTCHLADLQVEQRADPVPGIHDQPDPQEYHAWDE